MMPIGKKMCGCANCISFDRICNAAEQLGNTLDNAQNSIRLSSGTLIFNKTDSDIFYTGGI